MNKFLKMTFNSVIDYLIFRSTNNSVANNGHTNRRIIKEVLSGIFIYINQRAHN